MTSLSVHRRTVLAAIAAAASFPRFAAASLAERKRVGVIGHTGRGDYGHALDTVWMQVDEAQIVAVADADPAGLEQAKQRLNSTAGYADYRTMLRETRPQIVAVCPRHPDQHLEMIVTAIDAGAEGIYVEKPFCRTPAEADAILAAANGHNAKVAVAHSNRYHPALQAVDALIADGGIGRVLEIRGRGKGDRRGGGEDLWVLGSHVLNLFHYFGGAPLSCSAVVKQQGRKITRSDVREGNEALGPLAGDEVHARFDMERGMVAYFDSIANDETGGAAFGIQIIGSDGIIDIKSNREPLAHLLPGSPYRPTNQPRPWVPISSAGAGKPEPLGDVAELVGHHVLAARDLIAAIRDDRQPLCSAADGALTVEMICAVFESHRLDSQAVPLPLERRDHPLGRL